MSDLKRTKKTKKAKDEELATEPEVLSPPVKKSKKAKEEVTEEIEMATEAIQPKKAKKSKEDVAESVEVEEPKKEEVVAPALNKKKEYKMLLKKKKIILEFMQACLVPEDFEDFEKYRWISDWCKQRLCC